jgi:hypothetical protein
MIVICLYCGKCFIYDSPIILFLFNAIIKYGVLSNSDCKNDSERYLEMFKYD